MDYDVGIVKQRRIISPSNSYFSVPSVASYTGPGDIPSIPSADHFWGVRAYSAAKIGTNAIRVHTTTGPADLDFALQANGFVDPTAITTFIAGGTGTITVVYDQIISGNSINLDTSVSVGFPLYATVNLLPMMSFDGTRGIITAAGVNLTSNTQPFTMSAVAEVTGNFTAEQLITYQNLGATLEFNDDTAHDNSWSIYAGTASQRATATDSKFHAAQCLISGASSNLYLDGTGNTGTNIGTRVPGGIVGLGITGGGLIPLTGYIGEVIMWSGDQSSFFSALNTNQHTYYAGF